MISATLSNVVDIRHALWSIEEEAPAQPGASKPGRVGPLICERPVYRRMPVSSTAATGFALARARRKKP
jgi:hypothetical protein